MNLVCVKKSLHIVKGADLVNFILIVGKINLIGFLDSICIVAALIVYLHCIISVNQSIITRLEL